MNSEAWQMLKGNKVEGKEGWRKKRLGGRKKRKRRCSVSYLRF